MLFALVFVSELLTKAVLCFQSLIRLLSLLKEGILGCLAKVDLAVDDNLFAINMPNALSCALLSASTIGLVARRVLLVLFSSERFKVGKRIVLLDTHLDWVLTAGESARSILP